MKTQLKDISLNKSNGRIYTPNYIVRIILDEAGYNGEKIIGKHAIDNSCGDGAFLTEIVKRYCEARQGVASAEELKGELETFIHGIEIDSEEHEKCVANVSAVAEGFNIHGVDWDIRCADTLETTDLDGKMDFVLGNPPYVRVHNLADGNFNKIKQYAFSKNGMTDLFIVFYEIGLKMLNKNGVLGYITPSSFFNSIAGSALREHLISNNLIAKIIDLKHFQAFEATTYTTIAILKNNKKNKAITYSEFDEVNLCPVTIADDLCPDDIYIAKNFYFASKENLKRLKRIMFFREDNGFFAVKNGFATLADKFFIGKFDFSEHVIPIVKASTGKHYTCIFPYDKEGRLIPLAELAHDANLQKYYRSNQQNLTMRSLEKASNWHGFGRSQGINDVYKMKYAINTLLRGTGDIKLTICPPGVGVYSGLYIMTSVPEAELREILYSNEFVNYVSMLSKYKSGGYYTFSSKDLKVYLEYKYAERNGVKNGQCRIFADA